MKVACIGDSITFGAGIQNRNQNSYPAQLAAMLGHTYEVKNFGVSGATMLQKGNLPYWSLPRFQDALAYQPDIVIIKLGTNDSKPQNWQHHSEFEADYTQMLQTLKQLPSQPQIWICLPAPAFAQRWGINNDIIQGEIIPVINQVAAKTGTPTIDIYHALIDHPDNLPDKVHPNADGAKIIAQNVASAIQTKKSPQNEYNQTQTQWIESSKKFHSFTEYHFKLAGVHCKVVAPHQTAEGKPWIWRARFWGHKPQVDIALLKAGYHIAYTEARDLYGSPKAMQRWDRLYQHLTHEHGFDKKVALQALSRGGLFAYKWAAQNPEKIHCIYADAPVCDIKSWPGGKGQSVGSPKDWAQLLKAYSMTETEALTYKGNPIDQLEPLAKAEVPLLHVVGAIDALVPVAENTAILEQRYKALGGNIQIISKPDGRHHPHGLPDPSAIIEFIINNS